MIRTLIFDIGNVLADFDWKGYLAGWKLPEEERRVVERELFLSPLWKEIDRGVLSDEEILRRVCAAAPELSETFRKIYRGAAAAVSQYDYAPGLLKALREKGFPIYILSNYGKTFYEDRLSQFDFLAYTDGQVISYEVRHIKPEPEIYKILLSRFSIDPKEALFFDDLPANVEAARAFGIHAVQVKGYASIVRGLKEYGIEI